MLNRDFKEFVECLNAEGVDYLDNTLSVRLMGLADIEALGAAAPRSPVSP